MCQFFFIWISSTISFHLSWVVVSILHHFLLIAFSTAINNILTLYLSLILKCYSIKRPLQFKGTSYPSLFFKTLGMNFQHFLIFGNFQMYIREPLSRWHQSLSWTSFHHDISSASSRQAHGKFSPLCGPMTLFAPSLKLLLEEDRKCCHRSAADLLTRGSQQPLPTHKQHWAEWGCALGWGCIVWLFVQIFGQRKCGVWGRSKSIIYKQIQYWDTWQTCGLDK